MIPRAVLGRAAMTISLAGLLLAAPLFELAAASLVVAPPSPHEESAAVAQTDLAQTDPAQTDLVQTDLAQAATGVRPPTQRGRIRSSAQGWHLTRTNVGLAPHGLDCDSLKPYTGPTRVPAGTRIKRRLVTVPLDLSAGNIVVAKSCVRPAYTGSHNQFLVTTTSCAQSCRATQGRVVIRDSEISGWAMGPEAIAKSCGFHGIADLKRNLIHGMGTGICYIETGFSRPAVAEHNYVVDLRSYGDSHNEAATVRDFRDDDNPGRRLQFLNNRLDCSSGNVTGGLFIQSTWVDIRHVDVIGNYLEGEGYNLFVDGAIAGESGTYDDIRAIDNRFRSTGWGETTVMQGDGWDVWRNNYVYNPQRRRARGRAVGQRG